MNTENRNMSATSGEVFWRDPDDEPPPRGTKLLLLTTGGITVTGDWRDDSNYKAWSPMPKLRRKG